MSVFGAVKTAQLLAVLGPGFTKIGGVMEPREVNGQPGAILRDRDGKVHSTWTLDILDGRVQAIRVVSNPEKLGHLGPVTDAAAVMREAFQASRSANGAKPAPRSECSGG